MNTQYEEQDLALAGICQSASLVQKIARTGEASESAVEASLSSILVTSPDNTQQVYGSLQNLKTGFTALISQIDSDNTKKDPELTRYIASIISLERKLNRQHHALNELGDRVSHVQRQLAHVDFENNQIITNLASIYSDVVSPLAPKIQVSGNPKHLTIETNQKKVRALLLAGVRSAVLWRQLGGKRRQILFNRKALIQRARAALRLM